MKFGSYALALRQTAIVWIALTTLYFLYDLPSEAIIYSAVLVVSLSLVTIGFYWYRERQSMDILKNALSLDQSAGHLSPPEARSEEAVLFRSALAALGEVNHQRENALLKKEMERSDSLATWVHQIKTPIAAMMFLLKEEDLENHREALGMELFKIEQYVETVLHMERIGSSNRDLLLGPVDLLPLIKGTIRKLRTLFIGRGLKLVLDVPEDLPFVLGDEKWLGIALEQLLTNAIKYTVKGEVRLRVGFSNLENHLCLRIEDTGIGIAKEDLPLIFEKGYTGYHGRYDHRSTGLGLYLTKKALAHIGTSIRILSEVGRGTEVLLEIPMSEKRD